MESVCAKPRKASKIIFRRCEIGTLSRTRNSGRFKKRHEPVDHVQLHVAMEQREAGLIRSKIDFHFLIAAKHRHVLDNAGSWFPGDFGQLEEARRAYQRALESSNQYLDLHPNDARTYVLGAGALARLGETERATEWADRAMS
jgi:tetratricopeptide (TPR) repeat protein